MTTLRSVLTAMLVDCLKNVAEAPPEAALARHREMATRIACAALAALPNSERGALKADFDAWAERSITEDRASIWSSGVREVTRQIDRAFGETQNVEDPMPALMAGAARIAVLDADVAAEGSDLRAVEQVVEELMYQVHVTLDSKDREELTSFVRGMARAAADHHSRELLLSLASDLSAAEDEL